MLAETLKSKYETKRDEIISKIRKLSKFTTANGCTEGEALLAAAKISELTAQYNVSSDELTIRADASGCITDEFINPGSRANLSSVCSSIGKLFGTKCWHERQSNDALDMGINIDVHVVKFFGPQSDVAASLALTAIVFCAITTEARKYQDFLIGTQKRTKKVLAIARSDADSFRLGMAHRLAQRIREMREVQQRHAVTGTALISLKNQLVTDEFAKLNLRLYNSRGPAIGNPFAAAAGASAANRVDLGGSNRINGAALRLTHRG